jgi:hypothetical protein
VKRAQSANGIEKMRTFLNAHIFFTSEIWPLVLFVFECNDMFWSYKKMIVLVLVPITTRRTTLLEGTTTNNNVSGTWILLLFFFKEGRSSRHSKE